MTIEHFGARVLEITDGDTIKAALLLGVYSHMKDRDLGFHIYVQDHQLVMHADLRFMGSNAAEHGTPGGDAAKANLATVLPVGALIDVASYGADKYGGRYDARIYLPDGTDLINALIDAQWLASWNGHGTKPVPPWPRTVP